MKKIQSWTLLGGPSILTAELPLFRPDFHIRKLEYISGAKLFRMTLAEGSRRDHRKDNRNVDPEPR